MKPIIGITAGDNENCDIFLRKQYCTAVAESGGVPVILPHYADPHCAIRMCDGLIFSGGGDLSPEICPYDSFDPSHLFEPSPARDRFEIELSRLAYEKHLPSLGICRGVQVMNFALGGNIVFHISAHRQVLPKSSPSHSVLLDPTSLLAAAVGESRLAVNSFHHQAANLPGKGLIPSAVSADGVIEATEAADRRFFIGVQWHPEHLGDEASKKLFAALCRAAKSNIHKQII